MNENSKYTFSFSNLNKRLFLILLFVMFVYFVVQIIATAISNTYQDISYLRSQKEQLRRENEILVSEIGKAKSYISAQDIIEKYKLEKKNINYVDYIDSTQAFNEKR
jgi:cell division protein FtsB